VIQAALRRELGKDVTLLTVAHRLQSIMDFDRVVRLFLVSTTKPPADLSRWFLMRVVS
jgi:ABC-type transport system involved in cytochrome bd biosynthesis fused ATPase/permease subunit